MLVLGSLVCEWLPSLAVSQACWQCLSLALQYVSGCYFSLCLKPADNACPWLSRGWVAVIPCCISSLLKMPVLDSLESEWLPSLSMFQACWQCLSLSLQDVSGCHLSQCFKPADDIYSLLSRKWVAAMPCWDSSMLMEPLLGSPASEWLLCITAVKTTDDPCLWNLQIVNGWLPCCVLYLLMKSVLGSSLITLIHGLPACMYMLSLQAC